MMRLFSISIFAAFATYASYAKAENCALVEMKDKNLGTLAGEVKTRLGAAGNLAICQIRYSGRVEDVLFIATNVESHYNVKNFKLYSPYAFKSDLGDLPELNSYMLEEPAEPAIKYVCVVDSRCANIFDDGYALVNEDADSSQYHKFSIIWQRFNSQILDHWLMTKSNQDAQSLRAYVESGGSLLPTMITTHPEDLGREEIFMEVSGETTYEGLLSWSVVLISDGDGLHVVEVNSGSQD